MTVVYDDPESFASTAIAGFSSIYSYAVRAVPGGVVRATTSLPGKVALVVGGGSGHYPAFAGFVGAGIADAAATGDVFASPSAQNIAQVSRLAHHGGGILLGFGNYAGDVMNFGLAAERLASEGFAVRLLAVTDDLASAPPEKAAMRRGVAGNLIVFKIAGAAAEAGETLHQVERIASKANARTVSFGVAFNGCTLPGAAKPLFTVRPRRMAIGLGIHGEPGIGEDTILPATELACLLVDRLLKEKPANSSDRVAALLNGLGGTKCEELFVLWTGIAVRLKRAGLTVVAPEVGEYVTSLDMAGCSLTLTWLDSELESYWCAPSDAPVLRRGAIAATASPPAPVQVPPEIQFPKASAVSREGGRCIVSILDKMASALRDAEAELGELDARVGDGDHGMGMTRGSFAAAEAARTASAAGAGSASVLGHAGDAWADRAGGTSGALWGLALRTCSAHLGDHAVITPVAVARGIHAALDAVIRLGHAQVGDKTMVDSLAPFVSTLEAAVGRGETLASAWNAAAQAATSAAQATAQLAPRLGRARSHTARSLGHPDAGAVSLALCTRIVAAYLQQLDQP